MDKQLDRLQKIVDDVKTWSNSVECKSKIMNDKIGDDCAQYRRSIVNNCLTLYNCGKGRFNCCPIPFNGKRANRFVAALYGWWCIDQIEKIEIIDAISPIYVYSARTAKIVDVSDAKYLIRKIKEVHEIVDDITHTWDDDVARERASDITWRTRDIVTYGTYTIYRGSPEPFYLAASVEIEKLIAAWGTPEVD